MCPDTIGVINRAIVFNNMPHVHNTSPRKGHASHFICDPICLSIISAETLSPTWCDSKEIPIYFQNPNTKTKWEKYD